MEFLGYLIMRLFFGGIFLMHGMQMLGVFSGNYLKGALLTTERERFRPLRLWAALLAYGNLAAGLSVLLGVLTILGSAIMVTVIVVVLATSGKFKNGFFNKDHGYEYPLSLIGGGLTAGLFGPGPISIDAVAAPWLISPSLFLLTLVVCLAIAVLGLLTRGPVKQEPVKQAPVKRSPVKGRGKSGGDGKRLQPSGEIK